MNNFIAKDGRTISFQITDNYSEKPKMVRGKEKIGRFINFYDERGMFIKMTRIWGTFDEMQNVTPCDAKKHFEEY